MNVEQQLKEHTVLVRQIASSIHRRVPANVERDDLIQAGMIGLHEALVRFVPQHGVEVGAYVRKRVRGAMIDELRRQDWLSRTDRKGAVGESFYMASLDEPDENGEPQYDVADNDSVERRYAREQQARHLVAEIERLPEREKLIMSMLYEQDMTLMEISAVLKISESRVCQIHKAVISKLSIRLRGKGH